VRRTADLDRATREGALGHEALKGGGDVLVLLAEQEPRRQLLPQRPLARGLLQRLQRHRTLRDRHASGLHGRHVGGELVVEQVLGDRQVGRAVAAGSRADRITERAARELGRELEAALSGVGGKARDVDEPGDLAGVGGDVRDHGAAVGVTDQDDGSVDGSDEVADRVSVGG